MDKYEEGIIFKLYDDDERNFVIFKRVELEENLYLLVAPISNEQEEVTINSEKILLLRVDIANDKVDFEKDEKIVSKVVSIVLNS